MEAPLPIEVTDDNESDASDSKIPGTPSSPQHNNTVIPDDFVNTNQKGKKSMTSSIIQMI